MKANKTLGCLCRNLNISSNSVKEQAYESLVSFEYACSAWEPYNKGKIDQLEIVQFRTRRQQTTKHT